MQLGKSISQKICILSAIGLMVLGGVSVPSIVSAKTQDIPYKASIDILGTGGPSNAEIILSVGPKQKLRTQSDGEGNFAFRNLSYSSHADLAFTLDLPSYKATSFKVLFPQNKINVSYNVREAIAKVTGNIGPSGTISMYFDGAENGADFRVAGREGDISISTRSNKEISGGYSKLVASIINVGEICCPTYKIPGKAVNITLLSKPVRVSALEVMEPVKVAPVKTSPRLQFINPIKKNELNEGAPQKSDEGIKDKIKKIIPFINQGKIEDEIIFEVDSDNSYAFSADFDNTYVGGIKKVATHLTNAITFEATVLGAMLDGRNLMDTLRTLQISSTQTLKNYVPSDALCRFGTLSKSTASADTIVKKNKLAIGDVMLQRNKNRSGTLFADSERGMINALENFTRKYCDTTTNNGMEKYCSITTSPNDVLLNRDVDFSRVFESPMTLDLDFTDGSVTNDEQSILALLDNLSLSPRMDGIDSQNFSPSSDYQKLQDVRSYDAMKSVSANSFASLVAEKAKTTAAAGSYMHTMLTQLGLTTAQAKSLIGDNPSYFAQMEVLTKKLFQNPQFYVNLYEGEANIDRQRVAMKAIELQQDRDFLESLRRREMLLSTLLNSKINAQALDYDENGRLKLKR